MWFKESREDVNDDARPGCPNTSTTDKNIEAVKKIILDNRRITIREVADDVGTSFGSSQAILKDVLGMKHMAAKIVPKLQNFKRSKSIKICSKRSKLVTNKHRQQFKHC